MTSEIWLAILTFVFSAGGASMLTKWRLDRADLDRGKDKEDLTQILKEVWSAINKERTRIDGVKEDAHKHQMDSYEERLKIAEKFSVVALAQSNLSGDLKASVATMARVEKKVDEIAEEVKKS